MLPTHTFRLPTCPFGRAQSVYAQERERQRDHDVEEGSGMSPSEIVKRKLHQRLMDGQAKKRRLSEESNAPPGPLGPLPAPLGPLPAPRTPVPDIERRSDGFKNEPRDGDGEEKAAQTPGGAIERRMSAEDSSRSSSCSGKCSEETDVHRTLVHLGIRNPHNDGSGDQKQCVDCREGPQRYAGSAKGRSLDEMMTVFEDPNRKEASMSRSDGSSLFHKVIGRLDKFTDDRATGPRDASFSSMTTRTALLPPSSVGAMPFATTVDTIYASKTTSVPVERESAQHCTTDSLERIGDSTQASTYDNSTNSRMAAEQPPPNLTAFEEFAKDSELHKLKKKKSRRTPKVKKIKFHEYKGPHRRSLVSNPKTSQANNRLSQVDKPSPANSVQLPIAKVGLSSQNSLTIAASCILSTLEKSTNVSKHMTQTDTTISHTVFASHLIDFPMVNNDKYRTTEGDRLKCSLTFDRPNLLDFRNCPATSDHPILVPSQSEIRNSPIACSMATCIGNPAVASITKAGTSAALLVAAPPRRKEKLSTAGSRLVNVCEKRIVRRDSAVLSAPVTLDDLKVIELKQECKRRKLSVTGPKPRLVNRLLPYSDAILCQKKLSTVVRSTDSRSNSFLPSNFRSSPPTPELKVTADIPFGSRSISPAVHGKAPTLSSTRGTADDENDSGADERRTSAPRPSSPGPGCAVLSQSSCGAGAIHSVQTGVGDAILQSKASTASNSDDVAATSKREHRINVSINRGTNYANETGELNACKGQQQPQQQQQLLTPPATPTLVTSHSVFGYSQSEGRRSSDTEDKGNACKQGAGLNARSSRWMCHLTRNGVPVTLTDTELWIIQERQIVELQWQLQKSKAELICARRKVCLDRCNDFLPLGVLIRGAAAECTVPNCLSEEAQLALSSAIENAERIFSKLTHRDSHHVTERPPNSISEVVEMHPKSIDEDQKHGIPSYDDSHDLTRVSTGLDEFKTAAMDCDDAQTKQLTADSLPCGDANLEHKDYLYESAGDLCGLSETMDVDDETNLPIQSACYAATPAKKPPDYYEAIRQKLLQGKGATQRDVTEQRNPTITTATTLSMAPPDGVGAGGCDGPSTTEAIREEEIEDVLEVLRCSGELNATDIQAGKLLWQQDSAEDNHRDFISMKQGLAGIENDTPLKDLRSPQQRYFLQNSELNPWESDIGSRRPQFFGFPPEFIGEGPFESRTESFGHRVSKASESVGNSLGMAHSMKEEIPPSTEFSEFLFDWNEVESNLRFNAFHNWDPYPSPDESIICSTPNRDPNSSESIVNGSFSDWKANTNVPIFHAPDDWSAVTPCNSATSSESTNGDDAIVLEHQFLTDGSLGIISPGMTPSSANTAADAKTDSSGDALSNAQSFHRDSQAGNDWMEVFIDSNHFVGPSHLTGGNSPELHSNFSFSQGFYLGENGQSYLVQ